MDLSFRLFTRRASFHSSAYRSPALLWAVLVAAAAALTGVRHFVLQPSAQPGSPDEFITGGAAATLFIAGAITLIAFSRERSSSRRGRIARRMANAVPVILFRVDPHGRFTSVNAQWTSYTGERRSSSLGRGWLTAVHPADVERALTAWSARERTSVVVEFRLRSRDGEYRWHQARARFVPGRETGRDRWYGTLSDVHDAKEGALSLATLRAARQALDGAQGGTVSIAEGVADLVVPEIGDACWVVAWEDGETPRIVARRVDDLPTVGGTSQSGSLNEARLVATARRIARSNNVYYACLHDDDATCRGGEGFRSTLLASLARTLSLRSCVALSLEGTFGFHAVVLIGTRDGRSCIAERRSLVRDIVGQARVSIENARAQERGFLITSVMERHSAPLSFPLVPNVRFSSVYRPGRADVRVGGDWYDVFALPSGSTLVSIGDVGGSGIEATMLMKEIRRTVRSVAMTCDDEVHILELVDRMMQHEHRDVLATALVGVLEPSMRFRWSSAGHLPPYLRDRNGEVHELSGTGLPLGLTKFATTPDRHEVMLEPGSLLVLYTDGLVESTRNVLEGVQRLRAAVARNGIAADPAAAIVDAVAPEGARDDLAVLCLGVAA